MRRAQALTVVWLVSACARTLTPPPSTVLEVVAHEQSRSRCFTLTAVGGTETLGPYLIEPGSRVAIPVLRGKLLNNARVTALGHADDACTVPTQPAETSSASLNFISGHTVLTLRPGEATCDNGLDDDDDGFSDCADPDCDTRPCAESTCVVTKRCAGGSCGGGVQRTCMSAPSSCFKPVGVCLATTGCVYETLSSCDDGDRCTLGDTCASDGGCAGQRPFCVPAMCEQVAAECGADGGCRFEALPVGTPCGGDANVCLGARNCVPSFRYQPSNLELQTLPPPGEPVTLTGACANAEVDTSGAQPMLRGWCDAGVPLVHTVEMPDGGPLVVLVSSGFTIEAQGRLRLTGDKPVAIVAQGDITVVGKLLAENASPCTEGNGAGGAQTGSGFSGGGGGGFGSPGGSGGSVQDIISGVVTGGLAGAANGTPALVPLRGGCAGAAGGGASAPPGGRGGGAVQLSASGRIVISGTITAPGRGGPGAAPLTSAGGSGGGSGGGILLEAHQVVVSAGSITANGGGGGQSSAGLPSLAGDDGSHTGSSRAPGGGNAVSFGNGGAGAAASGGASAGVDVLPLSAAGGGGGGVGRVRLRTFAGCSLSQGVVLSPEPVSDQAGAGCR